MSRALGRLTAVIDAFKGIRSSLPNGARNVKIEINWKVVSLGHVDITDDELVPTLSVSFDAPDFD